MSGELLIVTARDIQLIRDKTIFIVPLQSAESLFNLLIFGSLNCGNEFVARAETQNLALIHVTATTITM